ncbi:MAG TPA: spore protease YyaC [Verrucomicrobiae bacterium]|nr:spore protease YyaC [Verrucomicrobiae bacterium]
MATSELSNGLIFFETRFDDKKGVEQLGRYLARLIPESKKMVIFCIGSERVMGDALGPYLGSRLQEKGFNVIGTLKEPCHAKNLRSRIKEIPVGSFVLAVDASITHQEEKKGNLILCSGAVEAGKSVGKELPPVGDIHIKGLTATGGCDQLLYHSSLNLIVEMAQSIDDAISLTQTNRATNHIRINDNAYI